MQPVRFLTQGPKLSEDLRDFFEELFIVARVVINEAGVNVATKNVAALVNYDFSRLRIPRNIRDDFSVFFDTLLATQFRSVAQANKSPASTL